MVGHDRPQVGDKVLERLRIIGLPGAGDLKFGLVVVGEPAGFPESVAKVEMLPPGPDRVGIVRLVRGLKLHDDLVIVYVLFLDHTINLPHHIHQFVSSDDHI